MKNIGKFLFAGLILAIALLQGCSQFPSVFPAKGMSGQNSVSQSDESLFDEAKRASDNGDKSHAEEIYREYIRKHPKGNPIALGVANARLGMLLSEKKEYAESRECFEKAMNYKPGDLEICGAYANSLFEQEDYVGAESLWRQGLQIAPKDKRFQKMLGYTLAQEKKYEAGVSYLKRAVGEQKAYAEMEAIYKSHQEYDKAALAKNKSINSQNKEFPTEQNQNYALRNQNVHDSAAAIAANNVPVHYGNVPSGIQMSSYNNAVNNSYNQQPYNPQQYSAQYPPQPLNNVSQYPQPQPIPPNSYRTVSIPNTNPNISKTQTNDGFASTNPQQYPPASTPIRPQPQPQNYYYSAQPQQSYPPQQQQPYSAQQQQSYLTPQQQPYSGQPYSSQQPPQYNNGNNGNYATVPQNTIPQQPTTNPQPPLNTQSPGVRPAGMPYGFATSQPRPQPAVSPQEIAQRPDYIMPPIQNYPIQNQSAPYYAAQPVVNPLARTNGYDAAPYANTGSGNAVSGQMSQTFNP